MAERTKRKSTKKKASKPKVSFAYPAPPHMPGVDWVELPVRSVDDAYDFFCALGFRPRADQGAGTMVALGGYVLMLKPNDGAADDQSSGITIQVATDHIERKREQLTEAGVTVSPVTRSPRGDATFEATDPHGHTVRFCGPVRKFDDPVID